MGQLTKGKVMSAEYRINVDVRHEANVGEDEPLVLVYKAGEVVTPSTRAEGEALEVLCLLGHAEPAMVDKSTSKGKSKGSGE
jgi:hypothetical protein